MFLIYTLKSIHLIGMVCWFAGLFYVPRLFVYHVSSNEQSTKKTLEIMQYKLLFYITTPAGIVTWLAGLAMLYVYAWDSYKTMLWLHYKLLALILLTIFHITMFRHHHRLVHSKNTKTGLYFRLYNEIPTIFLILIVSLAVFKPM
jgi:putative membrane protein